MSGRDWELAPEGATHYDTRQDRYPWLKADDNGNKFWHVNCWVNYANDIGVNDSIFARPSKLANTIELTDANGNLWRQVKVNISGTVEFELVSPPIQLINRGIYEFDYSTGNTGMQGAVMRYCEPSDSFFFDNTRFERRHCTNITLLTPED